MFKKVLKLLLLLATIQFVNASDNNTPVVKLKDNFVINKVNYFSVIDNNSSNSTSNSDKNSKNGIVKAIEELKEAGFWIYGADMDGETLWDSKLEGKIALVIGNEGSGISRLVREKCDFIVSIPMRGNISSLNASNAAAVVMYEVARQSR